MWSHTDNINISKRDMCDVLKIIGSWHWKGGIPVKLFSLLFGHIFVFAIKLGDIFRNWESLRTTIGKWRKTKFGRIDFSYFISDFCPKSVKLFSEKYNNSSDD